MLPGRYNALEFDGRTARRYTVHACVIRHGAIEAAEHSEEPVEEITLPLARPAAMIWANEHFPDFIGDPMRALVDRLTRPTGELTTKPQPPLETWLNSLPPGGTFTVFLPGDDGYEEARRGYEAEQTAADDE